MSTLKIWALGLPTDLPLTMTLYRFGAISMTLTVIVVARAVRSSMRTGTGAAEEPTPKKAMNANHFI